MRFRPLVALAGTVAVALSAAGCSSPSSSPGASGGTITIRVQAQNSISAEPLYLAKEKGYFQEQGINLEIVDIPDVSAAFAAVQSGRLDVAFSPAIGVMQASRQGMKLKIVAPGDGVNPEAAKQSSIAEAAKYSSAGVYVSKASGITDLKGLAGKSIAVPELKSQPDGTITSVLKDNSVATDGIKWLNMGFVPALTALKDNKVDAAFLVSPFTLDADKAGLTRVMNPSVSFFPPGSGTSSWVASSDYVQKNTDAVTRFQKALRKADEWANANLPEVKQHVIQRAGLKLEPSQMPNSYFPTEFKVADLKAIDQKLVSVGLFPSPIDVTSILAPGAADNAS
ncbi:ABC transporter substrate-binding protein [Arthrobacter woluwensis]|uniref:ABC transporter substrate-binding protein n=1 Tax=Arthrobacter woluwensis TaxID=156980 RepID=UPI0037FCA8AA